MREDVAKMKYVYHAHGVELNRSYASQAVIDDGSPPSTFERDPDLYYQPSTRPGASLPHVWLGQRTAGPRVSTLDLAGKRRFCLFTGHGGDSWREAARDVFDRTGVEIETVAIGPHLDLDDLYGRWAELSNVAENGCVLVRPDLHVAWRCAELPDDPLTLLESVMRRVLGRSHSVSAPTPR